MKTVKDFPVDRSDLDLLLMHLNSFLRSCNESNPDVTFSDLLAMPVNVLHGYLADMLRSANLKWQRMFCLSMQELFSVPSTVENGVSDLKMP